AMLLRVMTWTPIDPATLTLLWVPPEAARPQTTNSLVSPAAVVAFRLTPTPSRVAPSETVARLLTVTTLRPTAAPTLADALSTREVPIALADPSVWFTAS